IPPARPSTKGMIRRKKRIMPFLLFSRGMHGRVDENELSKCTRNILYFHTLYSHSIGLRAANYVKQDLTDGGVASARTHRHWNERSGSCGVILCELGNEGRSPWVFRDLALGGGPRRHQSGDGLGYQACCRSTECRHRATMGWPTALSCCGLRAVGGSLECCSRAGQHDPRECE